MDSASQLFKNGEEKDSSNREARHTYLELELYSWILMSKREKQNAAYLFYENWLLIFHDSSDAFL